MSIQMPVSSARVEFALPAELQEECPRPIPADVDQARNAVNKRWAGYIALFVGAICILLAPLPMTKLLALYLLPLEYLFWIGMAICIGGLWALLTKPHGGKLKYLRDGIAIPAKIQEIGLVVTGRYQGQDNQFAFIANAMVTHPESSQPVNYNISSRNLTTLEKDKFLPPFRVGDVVTALYLPDKFEKTLALYDFLELTPEHQLLKNQEAKPTHPFVIFLAVLGIMAAVCSLFLMIYAFGRYSPIDDASWGREGILSVAGSLLIGAPLTLWFLWSEYRRQQKTHAQNEANREAGLPVMVLPKSSLWAGLAFGVMIFAGLSLFGAGIVVSGAYTLNACLDSSQGKFQSVKIDQMVEVTHNFVFREYEIEYHIAGDPKDRKMMSTPQHMSQFLNDDAEAEIGDGYWGWPHLRTIHPLNKEEDVRKLLEGMGIDPEEFMKENGLQQLVPPPQSATVGKEPELPGDQAEDVGVELEQ